MRREHPERMLLALARQRAKARGLAFRLTSDDIVIPAVCPVLGIPLLHGANGRTRPGSPTLDRIDPQRGYTPENVMVVSARANRLRGDATAAEVAAILKWMRKVGAP